jgi:hypothetical protein
MAIDSPQQIVGGNVIVEAEIVEELRRMRLRTMRSNEP